MPKTVCRLEVCVACKKQFSCPEGVCVKNKSIVNDKMICRSLYINFKKRSCENGIYRV